jgi:hypothetical protein
MRRYFHAAHRDRGRTLERFVWDRGRPKTARGLGHNAGITWEFSKHLHSTLGMGELLIALERTCEAVSSGDLGRSKTRLTSQAVALN